MAYNFTRHCYHIPLVVVRISNVALFGESFGNFTLSKLLSDSTFQLTTRLNSSILQIIT